MLYTDFEIKRELQNIDILALSHNNKIYANESKGQLEKYYEIVKNEYKNYELIPVFLTLDGVDPTEIR